MIRNAMRLLIPVGVGLLLASQQADIKRYLLIKRLSEGHPELVPAHGRAAYPQHPGEGTPDGTGEFDSASRGGPVQAG